MVRFVSGAVSRGTIIAALARTSPLLSVPSCTISVPEVAWNTPRSCQNTPASWMVGRGFGLVDRGQRSAQRLTSS